MSSPASHEHAYVRAKGRHTSDAVEFAMLEIGMHMYAGHRLACLSLSSASVHSARFHIRYYSAYSIYKARFYTNPADINIPVPRAPGATACVFMEQHRIFKGEGQNLNGTSSGRARESERGRNKRARETEEGKLRDFEEASRTMKATRSIGPPQKQGRPSLSRTGVETAAGGVRTVVFRGWRVKGRDVLGPVDTAESPERAASRVARKFRSMSRVIDCFIRQSHEYLPP
ncbi:hypothetical protein PUN28_002359 [Cardiocondyla obscurior]|uniref:Uncharacterized protein n=1 Tax=Cardiocondyla obscurior TaxID=286306 RepID=A0AAW2GTS3_9HYME